jgi:hypothetical protein
MGVHIAVCFVLVLSWEMLRQSARRSPCSIKLKQQALACFILVLALPFVLHLELVQRVLALRECVFVLLQCECACFRSHSYAQAAGVLRFSSHSFRSIKTLGLGPWAWARIPHE